MKTPMRALVLLTLAAAVARGDDWPHWGRTADRTRVPAESIVAPALHGSIVTGSPTVASAVAADGFLVTAGVDGTIRAFAEDTRAPLWTVALDVTVSATPLVDRGRVYVPCANGELRILRLSNGALLGTVATGGADQSSPLISGGLIFLGSGFPNASLIAIDPATMSVAWSTAFGNAIHSSPVIAGGKVVIATNSGTLAAFDPATGTSSWLTTVGGTPGMAAPIAVGSSIFLLAGATLSRVDADPSNWGTNGSIVLTDPSPVPGAALTMEHASSSLSLASGRVTGLVRFDYPLDLDGDGYSDSWTLREYAFAVDPATLGLVWQQLLSDTTVPSVNAVPPFKLLPAPVSLGASMAVASSLSATLRLLDPATGVESSSLALDAACQASPFVANARLYAMTMAGTLYAYEGTTLQPAKATGLAPDAVEVPSTPAALTWNASAAGSTYVVRIARDGEVLMNWDLETVVATNSFAPPALQEGFLYTWAVRVRSTDGACAPWTVGSFGQAGPVSPPGSLTATPLLRQVALSWAASPSPGIAFYRLTYGATTVDLGMVTSTVVTGLTALTSYTFEVRAVDHLGHQSLPVIATAAPLTSITIAGTPYATIAAALAVALPGDVVEIGEDVLQVTSTLQIPAGVTLRGASALGTRLEAVGAIVMIDALQGSVVQGLSLSGGLIGVRAVGSDVTIRNSVIRDMADSGVVVPGSANVINNTIVGNAVAGVRSTGFAAVRNNIVQQNGVGLSGIILSSYNIVADGYSLCVAGPGDRVAVVAFLDPGAGDYREQPHQLSLDAGSPSDDFSQEPALNGGRINMGAFGNTALAATSLTSGSTKPPKSSGGCGLTGLEALLLLALLRRRR
jgi:hypothetical protein